MAVVLFTLPKAVRITVVDRAGAEVLPIDTVCVNKSKLVILLPLYCVTALLTSVPPLPTR